MPVLYSYHEITLYKPSYKREFLYAGVCFVEEHCVAHTNKQNAWRQRWYASPAAEKYVCSWMAGWHGLAHATNSTKCVEIAVVC